MSFALASASSLQRVFRDRSFDGPVGKPLELAAAMNGWVSGQVVIIPGEKRLRNVRVDVADLRSWEVCEHPIRYDGDVPKHVVVDDTRIPGEACELSRVHYVEIEAPSPGKISLPGWYPDPLEPITAETQFDVEPGTVQPIWLRLKVPPDARPRNKSLYRRFYRAFRGPVTVHAEVEGEGTQTQQIDIELRVFKFTLPKRRILNIWTLLDGQWGGFYNWLDPKEHSEILLRAAFMLARFGITPALRAKEWGAGTPPSLERYEWFYKKILDLGVSHIHVDDHGWPVVVKNGWEDIAYRYVGSEWPPRKNIEMAQRVRKRAATTPLAKIAVAGVKPSPYLEDIASVWIYPSDETAYSLKERLALGDEVQWYSCCRPEGHYANVQLDAHPIDPRVLCWQLFQYDISGYYYWRATMTGAANMAGETPEDKWPNRLWSAATSNVPHSHNDGLLLYPGPNGVPWSSIRLESLRDGADDYDYLCILRDYVQKLKRADASPQLVARAEETLKVNPDVSACKTEYTKDPAVVERERRRVGAYIEEARQDLGEIGPIFPSGHPWE